ncbi:MAG: sirohydrochlorin cobaltochelatase [Christensenellaceae bacterium]|nr:sirohydrochlorin cobaltochelatase [Christensenellaceae bacterium]
MKKIIALIICVLMVVAVFASCAAREAAEEAAEEVQEAVEQAEEKVEEAIEEAKPAEEPAEEPSEDDDWESDEGSAAAAVDNAIAAIQVQEWTPETEQLCKDAKSAWDACPDDQKELIEERDYFERDTGDASLDDPLNQDDIGENEILVVSFGTSFNDSRVKDIGGIEKAIAAAFPDWSVRRAFTAQIIINHILARDGEAIDNMDQALQRAVDNGVKNLVVQPTHLMHGAEYDEMMGVLENYAEKFETVEVAEPLLGEVGEDATVINADKKAVAELVVDATEDILGYSSLSDMASDGAALVLMGHGTSHTANVTYNQMQAQMEELDFDNVFIGTVEGEPEETEVNNVIAKVKEAGYTKVFLRPLMVVAGDHANNDMADPEDEESWYSMFTADGSFDSVECVIEGLGRIPGVEDLYVSHLRDVIK